MIAAGLIDRVIDAALSTGGDFAEVFVEDKTNSGISLIGGKIEKTMSGRDYGIGIRIFDGFFSVYAYTNSMNDDDIINTALKAAAAIKNSSRTKKAGLEYMKIENLINPIEISPETVKKKRKIEIMRRAYDSAKKYDDMISQVTVGLSDYKQKILIANSEGLYKEDTRVRSRVSIQSIASRDGEMQTGYFAPGASRGFEFFENLDVEWYGNEASRIAKTMMNAEYCPSGKMPVIIDNGFGGVIFHEACGHGLEATSVAKGNSVFAGKLGEKVASDLVTAIDDGTLMNEWGSSNIDDEGNSTRKNILIENGILKGYMIDKLNGRRMDMEATGSSRRQSYKFAPTSRMSNTFIANGKTTKEEIIANTEKGLYAKYMGGGSVNTATGEFNFAVMEGYKIENGKITDPLRGATLIGTGMDVLQKIDMVGNNLAHGQGMCGSVSGSVPANVGQPVIRVSELTVGGRDGEDNA
ncbi:TldD protein [Dethiosulfatibacter aminovorans DSM 17477]|uniref:TldD protein n=1 Tax=Dethiosulfatibacter aminovorans DSM 17477 TaxID=1121476 RepID=A0A1M6FSJ9_9FIRM|nr:TldD/PmbA family protein [Dethiosulfatibacter aminovorans]SHJ00620.1 TldD protein [Dethiosulfatibacter aminovorans DSM 17477]